MCDGHDDDLWHNLCILFRRTQTDNQDKDTAFIDCEIAQNVYLQMFTDAILCFEKCFGFFIRRSFIPTAMFCLQAM